MENKWVEITENNRYDLKFGEKIKYHNGEEWVITELTDFELDYGYIKTNTPNKKISLVHPPLGQIVYVLR